MTMRVTGGLLRGRRLRVAGSTRLRPTSDRVRGAIFSILGPDACVGAKVLDLYAGTGMLGIEALSRGAESAVFVEVDSTLVRRMRDNLREMSVNKRALVVRGKVERVLDDLDGGYDLVFADPPYRDEVWDELMDRLGKRELVSAEGAVVVEYRQGTAMAETYGTLVRETRRRYGDSGIAVYRSRGR